MGWLVWAILVPVLYVLSAGPVQWLTNKGYLHVNFAYLFLPLNLLPPDITELIRRYIKLWLP